MINTEEEKLAFAKAYIISPTVPPDSLQGKKIAIVSFTGYWYEHWEGQSLLDVLELCLDEMADSLRKNLETIAGLQVMSYENVVSNKAYQALTWTEKSGYRTQRFLGSSGSHSVATAHGLKDIDEIDIRPYHISPPRFSLQYSKYKTNYEKKCRT
jgi:hypothetical protein